MTVFGNIVISSFRLRFMIWIYVSNNDLLFQLTNTRLVATINNHLNNIVACGIS